MDTQYSPELSAESLGHASQRVAYHGVSLDILRVEPDRGCPDISDSCLECPLDQCLWDYPPRERAEVKRQFLQSKQQ